MSSEQYATPLEKVRAWMNRGGDYPAITDVSSALKTLVDEWRHNKASGMDIVASAVADEIIEILKAYE